MTTERNTRMSPQQIEPGWYPDPGDPSKERYWYGTMWSKDNVRPKGSVPPMPPPQYQQAPKQRRHHPFRIAAGLLVILVLVIVLVAVATSSPPGTGSRTNPAAADITITRCSVDPTLGLPQASVAIYNHSSGTSNYIYQVDFLNPAGTVVAQGAGVTDNVLSHQTATDTVEGDNQVTGTVTCALAGITRTAS